MTKRLFSFLLCLSIFLFISSGVNKVHALSSIEENFDNLPDLPLWSVQANGGTLEVVDGTLKLSAPSGATFPYIYLNNGPDYLNGDFVLETRIKFTGPLSYGFGLNLTDSLLQNGTMSDLGWGDVIFLLWPAQNNTFSTYSTPCPVTSQSCNGDSFNNSIVTANWGEWHTIKVARSGNVYSVFSDNSQIFESKPSLKIVSQLWLGNPQRTGGVVWGNFFVDYIKINVIQPTPTPTASPTPTPTPTPTPLVPVVVIPGHEASWNFPAMLGLPGTNEWKIPSFIKIYDDLLASLRNAGYVDNTSLFVFGYDWRKNLDGLSDDLKTYLNNLSLSQKVKIIGHSYGGLVARSYLQKHGTGKVDKLLQVASPNMGAVNAYGLWEGGLVWDRPWWQKAALESIVEVNKFPDENKITTIRRLSPSVKDLLPVFDYLEESGVLKPESSLLQRNTGLTNDISLINSVVEVLGGTGSATKQRIKVKTRNAVDALLGKWEDGEPSYPDPFITSTEGDDTVLKTSLLKDFSSNETVTDSHAGLVSTEASIKKIFSKLGLDQSKVTVATTADNREKVLMVFLHSPGVLKVCKGLICNGDLGVYLSEQKMFMLPDYDNSNLDITITANGETGDYKLYAGKIDDTGATWRVTNNSLSSSTEIDSYTTVSIFDTTPPSITSDISPAPNSDGWNKSDVTVSWNVSDPESVTNPSGCGTTVINTDTKGTDITCSASSNGGSSSKTVTVKLDKTPPTQPGTPATTTPTNLTSQTWSWSSSTDSGTGVNGYWYKLSGDTTSDYSFIGDVLSWKTSLTAGNYQFHLKSEDKLGNQSLAVSSLGLLVDTASPSASWFLPLTDEIISGVSTIQVNTSDPSPSSGIEKIVLEFKRNNGTDSYHLMATLTTTPYRYDWNTSGLALDEYVLRATVTDKTGNAVAIERKVKVVAIITNVSGWTPAFGEISINWSSDRLTSTRVVYDTVTHDSLDLTKPNFGYPNSSSTINIDPKVSEHAIILTGLSDGTTYYWRVVSENSTIAIGPEKTNRTFTKDFSTPFTPVGGDVATNNNVSLASSQVLGVLTVADTFPVLSSDEVVSVLSREVPTPTEALITSISPTPQVLGETTDNFPWPIIILMGGLLGVGAILLWKNYF